MDTKLPADLVEALGERRKPKTSHQPKMCDVCGQEFNVNDLDEVFHHGPDAHEPKAA